jgi:predicted enzyme related to lactoylglutathione lyase
MKHGEPSFLEIGAGDAGRARTFFAGLFGWTFRDEQGGHSARLATAEVGVHPDDPARDIVVYFAVTDIEAAVARVRELGGDAPDPGPAQGDFGRFVECKDDQGIKFGLRQLPR